MSRILVCNEPDLENDSNYILIRGMLLEYAKQGEGRDWTIFRAKLLEGKKGAAYEPIMPLWATIIRECFRNGFMAPYVADNKIQWRQIRTSGRYHSLDLCTLCERPCLRREEIETGKAKWKQQNMKSYREPRTCWEESHA